MEKIIAFFDPAPEYNCLRLCSPNPRKKQKNESEADFLNRIKAQDIPANAEDVTVVDKKDLPPEGYYFRQAWEIKNGSITVDMEKAREVHLSNIRGQRDKALEALDVETLKGNDVQAEKQVLRDLPQNFDLSIAKTPEALKALWPDELRDFE